MVSQFSANSPHPSRDRQGGRAAARNGWPVLAAILFAGLAISLLGHAATKRIVERGAQERFREESIQRVADIEAVVKSNIDALGGVRGLFAASNEVTRDAFRQFVRSVGLGPGVLALEWVPRVPHAERRHHEQAARADGLEDFQFSELAPDGTLGAAAPRDEYYPVFYVEPQLPSERVLGLDLASKPEPRAAMERARDRGAPFASGIVQLLQLQRERAGFLVFYPMYEGGLTPATLADRRARLTGFGLAVYQVASLLRNALSPRALDPANGLIDLFDESVPGPAQLIYSNHLGGALAGRDDVRRGSAISGSVDVAGRRWRIEMRPPPAMADGLQWQPWLVLGAGLCLTVAGLLCVRVVLGRGRFAEELVRQRTAALSGLAERLKAEVGERGAVARALRASEERLTNSIESLSDGFALYDAGDRLVMWNSRYAEFDYRIRKHLVPGVTYQELVRLAAKAGQWRDSIYSLKQAPLDPRTLPVRERQLSDGRWLLIKTRETADGGLVDIRTDITDLKVQNEELRLHRDRLEELVAERTGALEQQALQLTEALHKEKEYNALQQQFISMVSHEFRTPLAIIDSTAQRMLRRREDVTPDEITLRLGKVRTAVKRLVVLIDDTLALSRIEAGCIELRRAPTDLHAQMMEVCEQQQLLTGKHQIVVHLQALPPQLDIDPDLMRQVFTNLLSNAVKYSPEGGLVEVTGGSADGFALVAVRDQGLGIPEQDLPQLFARFFRASNVTRIAGTGLGLHLCKHLVELHGGALAVDSAEGQGATFTVRLPLEVPAVCRPCRPAPLQVAQ